MTDSLITQLRNCGPELAQLLTREAADEIEGLRTALETAHQALLEVSHAQDVGANWYTKGESGLYNQVRMWVSRGLLAVMQALGLQEAKVYCLECKRAEWLIDKATFDYLSQKYHLPRHAGWCSNQNVIDPLGAYKGVEECGCNQK